MNARIPAGPEKTFDALMTRLDSLVPSFVLVDPFLGEPAGALNDELLGCDDVQAMNDARGAFWKAEVFPVALDEALGIASHQQPYLVECSTAQGDTLAETARIAVQERAQALASGLAPYRIGGWLQSARAPEDICAALSRLCPLTTRPKRLTSARYLRVADRRVLGLLCHVLGAGQIMARLAGLDRWIWLDDGGGLCAIERSEHQTLEPLVLDGTTWPRIARGSDLHPVRARLIAAEPDSKADFDRIDAALKRAREIARRWPARFATGRDVQDWALLALIFGDLENDPAVIQILAHGDPAFPEALDDPPEPLHLLMDAAFKAALRTREKRLASENTELRT